MHRMALWLHCFLAEAFKVLCSELRLESFVQLCSTCSPSCLTLLPQSESLPLRTVLNSFSFVLCFPLQLLCLTPGRSGTACSFHPCLCLILQHLILILECLSWCHHCKPSSHLPSTVFSFPFSMSFYFRGHIQHLLFQLGQLSFLCTSVHFHYCLHHTPLNRLHLHYVIALTIKSPNLSRFSIWAWYLLGTLLVFL